LLKFIFKPIGYWFNLLITFYCMLSCSGAFGQVGDYTFEAEDHYLEAFYSETKQVNQFIRRFNGEEDVRGVRFSRNDSMYRNPGLRKTYLNMLFDEQNNRMAGLLKDAFVENVILSENPVFLDFHGGEWFAEVFTKFKRGSHEVYVTLMMKLVKENLGSKWVIDDVRFSPYENLYKADDKSDSRFLHPLSHELDFMNLDKVFALDEHIGDYFKQDFEPCKLSIFLYELRNGLLQFEYVTGVKFHFFQIEDWYFEISEFNRPGLNRGWLISNLIKLEPGQKEQLINYFYYPD
jgi:hypothetical protein